MLQRLTLLLTLFLVSLSGYSHALDLKGLLKSSVPSVQTSSGLDNDTVVQGLKEALSLGTSRAVASVGQTDGFFTNPAIKILIPEKIRTAADVLGKLGYQQQVDDFVLSMNRAAEKAAPLAKEHFVSALKEMSFQDARGILQGGDTAATDYFRKKTESGIAKSFQPVISKSMEDVGVTRAYRQMIGPYEAMPLVPKQSLDIEGYVTNKAVDGLFKMLALEEQKIRTDPTARATDLLKKVFGSK
jgi:hypothetical protein